MSEEILQLLPRVHEAFNREGWAGLLPYLDPDFEFHEPPEQPGATVFHGPDEAREGWARWAEAWTEQQSEFEDLIQLPEGRVLILTRERMRGRDGIRVEQHAAHLVAFRDGKVLRWQCYWDRQHAFEAAGLRE